MPCIQFNHHHYHHLLGVLHDPSPQTVTGEVFWGMGMGSQESKKNPLLMRAMEFTGNIVIIGIIVAAYVGYTAYRQKNQGGGISKKRA